MQCYTITPDLDRDDKQGLQRDASVDAVNAALLRLRQGYEIHHIQLCIWLMQLFILSVIYYVTICNKISTNVCDSDVRIKMGVVAFRRLINARMEWTETHDWRNGNLCLING